VFNKKIQMELILLEQAIAKYSIKNMINNSDYEKPIKDFILKLFLNCDPASYGKQYGNKLIHDLKKIFDDDVSSVADNLDKGDLMINHYPNRNDTTKKSKYFEIKISFLGKSSCYTLRNLRPYQDLDGFIVTLVDCKNEFKEEVYLLSKEDLFQNIGLHLTPMNGTKTRNDKNVEIGYGVTIKKNSKEHKMLGTYNKLKGNKYKDLEDYMRRLNSKTDDKQKNDKTILKFKINNKEYVEDISVKNYLSFLTDVSKEKGFEFFQKSISSFFISKERKNKRFIEINNGIFINTKSSTEVKNKHITNICSKLGYKLEFLDQEHQSTICNSLKIEIFFCIIHGFSDDYISNHFKMNKEDVTKIRLKYSEIEKIFHNY